MHDPSLIATVAAAFTAAWLLGLLTQWLRLSPIVGYLLAGILIGPNTPGFVGDIAVAQQLAEVGVILLMFGVGLHFHVKDLLAVKNVAIPGAIVQSFIATVGTMALFATFDMPFATLAVLGMAMAVASTVVLMRVLMDAKVLNTPPGHVAVGWLIVEDVFTVVLLILIPVLGPSAEGSASAGSQSLWWTLCLALGKLVVLAAIVLWAGSRIVPRVLVWVARLRSRELFTLTVLVFSVAVAAASYFYFGASMALGAFLAGMVVAQSPVSHQAAADALPMRDAFAVLFFVSVGMLFDPAFLIEQPLMVAAALGIILLIKPLAALLIVAVLGHSVRTALTVAIGLAQIGEFSFILSELARQHGLMPDSGHHVIVAAAIISITINPLLFRALPRVESWLQARPRWWKLLNGRAERRVMNAGKSLAASSQGLNDGEQRAIVVGYGPVGRSVHGVLKDAGLATVVIDLNMDTISLLRAEGQNAIFGDASNEGILLQAGARDASHLVITVPDASQRSAVATAGRSLSSTLRIIVRARYLNEREELERSGVNSAAFDEAEAAVALARIVLSDTGHHREAAERKLKDIRLQLVFENLPSLGNQLVSSVMVPWSRVRCLSSDADPSSVLSRIAQERHPHWPVLDAQTGRPIGYLEAKDLGVDTTAEGWTRWVRPLQSVSPDESIESTLLRMRNGNDHLYLVEKSAVVLGIVTLGGMLDHVVGRLEHEYRGEAPMALIEAVLKGRIINPLMATTHMEAVRELIAAVPAERLPMETSKEQLIAMVLARDEQISTDLGNGIAIPHTRCQGLSSPLVIIGQSADGVVYSAGETMLVRLIFLLITPVDRPEMQLALLSQIARVAETGAARNELFRAGSPVELLEILERASRPAATARLPEGS